MIIYKATCVVNGKSYIGQTVHSLPYRRKQHVKAAGRGSKVLFHLALTKYSPENFTWNILDTAATQKELDSKEQKWIAECCSISPSGYNLRTGGSQGHWSSEVKQRISLAHKKRGTRPNDLALARAAQWHRGRAPVGEHAAKLRAWNESRKYVPASAEFRAKISAANKGKRRSLECRERFSRIQKEWWAANPEIRKHSHPHSNFTEEQVRTIREWASAGMCIAELACLYHATHKTMRRIVTKQTFQRI